MSLGAVLSRFVRRGAGSGMTVVTFTGGMGAQVISAAIYFAFRSEGREVYADLSYFGRAERVAVAGNKGEVSHWSWQLDPFGLPQSVFEPVPAGLQKSCVSLIEDGPKKMELGLQALRRPEVQKHFPLPVSTEATLPAGFARDYLCIHVRRGDYVNVSSHLVSDDEFILLADRLKGLIRHAVVVSDSPIGERFREAIAARYDQAVFLDDIDPLAAHGLMRRARILVCSNSQFSLVAAILNPQALVLLPRKWFGEAQRAIEMLIHDMCDFEILNPVPPQDRQ